LIISHQKVSGGWPERGRVSIVYLYNYFQFSVHYRIEKKKRMERKKKRGWGH